VFHKGKENAWLGLILLVVLGVMGGIGADKVPSPWFDEGWTLVVARNWVEHGNYAIRLADEWVSASPMAHAFSVTVPVAASFRSLGVGVLQGRLPSILFTVGILALLFVLARQMYGSKTAWITLVILVFMAPHLRNNPILFGRQVLGETPMLFYLLLGYWFWLRALRGSRISLVWVSLFWGLALISKRQILPFWLAAMSIMILVAALRRDWRVVKLSITAGLGAAIATAICLFIDTGLVSDWPSNGSFSIGGLYGIAAWSWVPEVRLGGLLGLIRFGLFSSLGLIGCAIHWVRRSRQSAEISASAWCEFSLIMLVGSWSFWYAFGSLGWARYYYPIFVLSAGFLAKLLSDWTESFSRWPTPALLQNSRGSFWKALVALTLIILNLGYVIESVEYIPSEEKLGVYQVSEYFHDQVDPDALVETYDSELNFLLRQPIHYPPDSLQMDLNRRTFLKQPITISYDPLAADPDYLVVGPYAENWQLYAPLEGSGDFLLVQEFPGYRIYRRARANPAFVPTVSVGKLSWRRSWSSPGCRASSATSYDASSDEIGSYSFYIPPTNCVGPKYVLNQNKTNP